MTATAVARKITSGRSLAKALGVGESAVRRWLDRSDWPFGKSPWSELLVPSIVEWANRTMRTLPQHSDVKSPQHWDWQRVASRLSLVYGEVPAALTVHDLSWLAQAWNDVFAAVVESASITDAAQLSEQQVAMLAAGWNNATADLFARTYGTNSQQWPEPIESN